jgi:hypothetical protein
MNGLARRAHSRSASKSRSWAKSCRARPGDWARRRPPTRESRPACDGIGGARPVRGKHPSATVLRRHPRNRRTSTTGCGAALLRSPRGLGHAGAAARGPPAGDVPTRVPRRLPARAHPMESSADGAAAAQPRDDGHSPTAGRHLRAAHLRALPPGPLLELGPAGGQHLFIARRPAVARRGRVGVGREPRRDADAGEPQGGDRVPRG